MRLGVFGGSFDPPHIGHLIFSEESLNKFNLQKIIWVVNHTPCHKQKPLASFNDRLEFCRILTRNFMFIQVSQIEENLDKPNFTCETLNSLRKEFSGKNDFFLMIGLDQAKSIDSWKNAEMLKRQVDFIVMMRDDGSKDLNLPEKRTHLIKRRIDVSSTEIRKYFKAGLSAASFVGNELSTYIVKRGIYI
ncbi:nicotinate (nicotinamide) nucleotide adenylyltransferase [candidate division WOR-3 bacterium]|nr:nicotinate (nicotinamide) nucleotide adenylyltransferase [candidate division WOR-3 bacterium]